MVVALRAAELMGKIPESLILVLYCSALLEPILNSKRTNLRASPLPAVAEAKIIKNFW
jgi:hypothetical protein